MFVCIKTADLALCWHTWHAGMCYALLADYIISCNAHSCGLQVTLGHSSVMPDGRI